MEQTLREAARERFVRGRESIEEIAAALGCDADEMMGAAAMENWKEHRKRWRERMKAKDEAVTPELEAVRKRYVEGCESMEKIAQELGVPYSRVRRASAAHGWAAQKAAHMAKQPRAAAMEKAVQLYLTTLMRPNEITRATGIEYGKLSWYLRKRGLKRNILQLMDQRLEQFMQDNEAVLKEAERAYVTQNGSLRSVAKEYGLSYTLTNEAAGRLEWARKRSEWRKQNGKIKPARFLTPAQYEQMRLEYVSGNETYRSLAQKYDVSENCVTERGSADGWVDARKAYREQKFARACGKDNGTPPLSPEDQLGAEEILEKVKYPSHPDEKVNAAVQAYVTGVESLREVAVRYGVPISRLAHLRHTYNLVHARKLYAEAKRARGNAEALELDMDIIGRTRKAAMRSMDGVADTVEAMIERVSDPEDWKALAEAMLKFVRLDYSTAGKLTPEEQVRHDEFVERMRLLQARIDAENRKREADRDVVYRVEWADGIEELAR